MLVCVLSVGAFPLYRKAEGRGFAMVRTDQAEGDGRGILTSRRRNVVTECGK